MNGTRLTTMASLLVTLSAPTALAVVSNPVEERILNAAAQREFVQSWKIPPAGQTLGRVFSASPMLETTGTLGLVTTVDPVTQGTKSRFGQLPLHLKAVFGGETQFNRWLKTASASLNGRIAFAGHVEKQLRHFISQHDSELSVSGLGLRWDAQRFFADDQHIFASFYLTAKGHVIEGAELTFRFTDGQLTSVVNKTFGAEKAGLAGFVVSASRATEAARALLGPSAKVVSQSMQKKFVPKAENGRYVFEPAFQFDAQSATGDLFTVTAHVSENKVLSWNAHTVFFDARISGVINQRSPRGPQTTVGMPFAQAQSRSGGLFGRTNTYSADAEGFIRIPNNQKANVLLSSKQFKVQNKTGASASAPITGDVVFDATSNSTLAENTTFYHLAVAQAWARPVINPEWFNTQVIANVNINDVCNAFWNGRSVNFFRGGERSANGRTVSCSNTGEMADVVYHEWGHGLHANTGGIRDGAFSEGIGDTVAQLITGSPDVGPGFFADGRPVRNLDGEYMYPPKEADREVHKEGLIFGSTYYHLTQALVAKYGSDTGRATARQWFLKILYTASHYTDSYEAILALDAESGRADGRGPNYCLINQTFARHGLAVRDRSCN